MSGDKPSAVRRLVTGHTNDGVAIIKNDGVLPLHEYAPGLEVARIWVTDSVPSKDNNIDIDGASRPVTRDNGLVSTGGTNCVITDLAPGASTPWHRASSVDHNILISGTVVLKTEDGEETLKPGDITIQRGTMHAWYNPGPGYARWFCVLVDGEPAEIKGERLEAAIKV
ncbi:unnamed protein product [Somion occarium]|uniref:Cupin type-2 domain-containing protein n=1 Tax=Somion occarium TaxID=3059160 RepID=A0ABP1CJ48_9APHY